MGRPDANPSAYEAQQIQTEYELQPQEYEPNHEATPNIPDEYSAGGTHLNNQHDQQYPPQQMDSLGNGPQALQQLQPFPPQQQFQPQPRIQYPPSQPVQQPTQYPPSQPNQGCPRTQQPAPYPPQNNPVYPIKPNQQAEAYPPQPVQYPPKSPPTNQMYANVSPVAASQPQTVAFPQPAYLPPHQCMPPASPLQPVTGQPPTAVSGIPVVTAGGAPGGEAWKTGLFDFFDDPTNALLTFFFPCLTFGQVAEIVDDGHTSYATSGMLYGAISFFTGMPCLISCTYRTKLRNKFGLSETPAPDWLIHCLCEPCALCQEYRELQLRGWDPSIGFHGNRAKMQQAAMMAPVNQRMMA